MKPETKFDWKKQEKAFYAPKDKPEFINIPSFAFFTIQGEGNPNDPFFADYIGVLYSLSYAVKMSVKTGNEPKGYFDYSIYPLEGIWDVNEKAKKEASAKINKNDLVFTLMIRQPEFVTPEYAATIIEKIKVKKPHPLLNIVKFESVTDGPCIQMLHNGSYDSEPESFRLMEQFAHEHNLERTSKIHREIYLTDARKTAPEKLKTILRFKVK